MGHHCSQRERVWAGDVGWAHEVLFVGGLVGLQQGPHINVGLGENIARGVGESFGVIDRIESGGDALLTEVGEALGRPGSGLGFGERREKLASEDRNDGNDDQ